MHRYIIHIFSVSLLLITACQNQPNLPSTSESTTKIPDLAIPDSAWFVYVNNGKEDVLPWSQLAQTETIWNNYLSYIRRADAEIDFTIRQDSSYALHLSADSLTLDSIGLWGDFQVFQISNWHIMHRTIVLQEASGKTRMLYTESEHIGSPASGLVIANDSGQTMSLSELKQKLKPQIKITNSDTLLSTYYFIGGNDAYWGEIAWKFMPHSPIPIRIK